MKDILILGKGYVGTYLNKALTERALKVSTFKKEELDYTSSITLQRFLEKNLGRYEVIINCSGYTGVPNVDACESNKEACWFWNVEVPHNIVLSANIFGIPVFNVSSGCIYSGYEKEYTETDVPNFGLYSNVSSYYSKCKHACETILKDLFVYTLRVRLPFDGTKGRKNYLNKLLNYNNLINYKNSMTSIEDFEKFIFKLLFIYKQIPAGPINVCNEGAVDAEFVVNIMKKYNVVNPNWKFVDMSGIEIVANRSNCVLDTTKIKSLNLQLPPVEESLERDILLFSKAQ